MDTFAQPAAVAAPIFGATAQPQQNIWMNTMNGKWSF